MNTVIYAIGDVHGRLDLLEQLHGRIENYHALMHSGTPAEIVYLGDYIDRGPNSIQVIDRVMLGHDQFPTTCLLGNHEAMMLECLQTDNKQAWYTWLGNGGDETLANLGVAFGFGTYDPVEFRQAVGLERIDWLRSLPLYRIIGDYLFVHAGIAPGVPIERQNPSDLLWIRGPFLESDKDHGFMVVHGHTPGHAPVVMPNRICIDTAAFASGILTAAVLKGTDRPIFLRAVE